MRRALVALLALFALPANAAVLIYRLTVLDSSANPSARVPRLYLADTKTELDAISTAQEGDLAFALDTHRAYTRNNASAWTNSTAPDATTGATGTVQLAGDLTGSAASPAIAADAVTYSKMQNVSAASKLLGRGDSGAGDPQEITLGTGLSMSGTTLSASGSGANAVEASVTLTSNGTYFATTVTGQSWVTTSSKIVCTPLGTTADGLTPEVIAIAGLRVTVANRVAATGFDVLVLSPSGLDGTVRIECLGV